MSEALAMNLNWKLRPTAPPVRNFCLSYFIPHP